MSPTGREDRGREIEWDEGEVLVREHHRKPDLLDELDFSTEVAGGMLHNIRITCILYMYMKGTYPVFTTDHMYMYMYTCTYMYMYTCT